MSEEINQAGSDTPSEDEGMGPEEESRADIAVAVNYGETFEACQVTARKVRAARELIELAGGYKEAIVLVDAVWFVASESDDANARVSKDEDDSEVEYRADFEAWEARTRKVMAAEKLLQLASGYDEAFMLLDAMEVVKHGKQGHNQVAKVRGAAGGYHKRAAAALKKTDESE
ncbi:MAG: hypothetical protein WCJ35_10980 [Planctomycetota bacterium]